MQNLQQFESYMALPLITEEIKLPFRLCHNNRGSRCSFLLQATNNKDMYFLEVPFSIPITLCNSVALCVPYFRINTPDKRTACSDPLPCKGKRVLVFRIRCQLKYLDYSKLYALVFFKNCYQVVTICLPLPVFHGVGEYTA